MLPRLLTSLLIFLGFAGPVSARTLTVELEVLHVAGLLSQAELDRLLASPKLRIEAHYQPTKLIVGETARREKIMPIGSKLFAIGQITTLQGAQIERQGRSLRFRVDETHWAHASYRLQWLRLAVPITSGPGRPQPDLEVILADPVTHQRALELVFLRGNSAFTLGLRLRYRWDDAQGDYLLAALPCDGDVQALGTGQYRFRPEQRLLRLFGTLDFDSLGRGTKRFMLVPPYPAPLGDWQVSDQQLVQFHAEGKMLESMSLRVERKGADGCSYMRNYDGWFADSKPIKLKRGGYGMYTDTCEEPAASDPTTVMSWNDDGTLGWFIESSPLAATRVWDDFRATSPACAGEQSSPPSSAEVATLRDEFVRLRAAFLKASKP